MTTSQRHGPTGSGLRRLLPIVAVCAAIGALAGLASAFLAADRYTGKTTILLRTPTIDNGIVASSTPPGQDERPYRTHVELLKSAAVQERARERLRAARIADPDGAVDDVYIDVAGSSNLAVVHAAASTPGRASQVADEYARAYLDVRRASVRSRLEDLAAALERRAQILLDGGGENVASVQRRAAQLRTLAAVEPADAQILRLAPRPRQADAPPFLWHTIAGLLAGLLVGIVLAVLQARRTRRVSSSEELEEVLGVPVLAGVPRSRLLDGRTMPADLPMAESEAFRMLRANLLHMERRRPLRSLLVTSAQTDEGKSMVSFNLAAVLAATGYAVLLVEADVRDPSISRLLGVEAGDGLAEVLLGDRVLTEALHEIPAPTGGGEAHTFDVLAAGLARVHAAELLDSDRMKAVLRGAQEHYDVVVVDTPPLSLVSDAIPLLEQVDAVIAVARLGSVPLDELARMRAVLERTRAPFVGVVANFVPPRSEAEYGPYAQRPAAALRASGATMNGRRENAGTEVMSR